jgi:hypothetical protein
MKKKILILITLTVIAVATLLLVYFFVYNKPHPDYASAEAEYKMTPDELFDAYVMNFDEAVTLYNGRMIEVTGVPDAFEMVDSLTIVVFQMDEGMFGPVGVRCTFMQKLPDNLLVAGKRMTIKGFCAGYNEEDVILEKCSIVKQ